MISKSLQLRKFAFALSLCAVVGASNAKAQYTVHANELISSTDFSNPLLSVDADLTSFSVNAFVGGSGATSNIRVRFPEWGAAGDVVNVIVKGNGGLLSASLLEDLSVKLYDSAGTIPVAEVTGSNILSLSLLAPFENIYSNVGSG